jgi:hypothetical protein
MPARRATTLTAPVQVRSQGARGGLERQQANEGVAVGEAA